ncbi:YsnF/AvaK domain-containing protein [Ramlibacter rhizophilus]|uniref:DUF2382 domain-containing protein n=1 Tax=Ramlibacter rhizophilus TaxID=1781167 RepID=A0A4Z0BIN4_9BURK|nr:YsnF/AvaK domain-containing protein [Ramlibacter rhizophilus]TFY98591.1 DUF2382 domain-containing protein [Ramlibacter rhizophilus]
MHTVIGAFDDKSGAQHAVDRLYEAGYDRREVHLEHGDATGAARNEEDRGGWSFFKSLFGSDESSNYSSDYDEAVRRGSYVVVVDTHSESEAQKAASILHGLGAYDVDERARQWRSGTGSTSGVAAGAAAGMPPGQAPGQVAGTGSASGKVADLRAGQQGSANVVQEEVKVGKRSVDHGGVRIVQRVSQKPVHEVVKLREEVATVDRRKVDRPVTDGERSDFREGTVAEVRESVEEPVVSKQARVVEEVRVGKDVRERDHTVDETVRRKDVDVERMDATRRESAVAADKGPLGTGKDKPTR